MNDQHSLTDQLSDLIVIANERGMYDAADYLHEQMRDSAWLRAVASGADDGDGHYKHNLNLSPGEAPLYAGVCGCGWQYSTLDGYLYNSKERVIDAFRGHCADVTRQKVATS
jgi:hypothetical protein